MKIEIHIEHDIWNLFSEIQVIILKMRLHSRFSKSLKVLAA